MVNLLFHKSVIVQFYRYQTSLLTLFSFFVVWLGRVNLYGYIYRITFVIYLYICYSFFFFLRIRANKLIRSKENTLASKKKTTDKRQINGVHKYLLHVGKQEIFIFSKCKKKRKKKNKEDSDKIIFEIRAFKK